MGVDHVSPSASEAGDAGFGSAFKKPTSALAKDRVYNFSAGPSMLPAELLQKCSDQMLNHGGSGMGVMEMSHRSKEFLAIYNQTEKDMREILSIPDTHKVMFLQGGATLQFASMPLNLLSTEKTTMDYIVTGQWGEKAWKEATKFGTANKIVDTKPEKFSHIPALDSVTPSDASVTAFRHYCQNETVNGVEFQHVPDFGDDVPLLADMSSNFLSRTIDFEKHAMVYAGAQKNMGPAGSTCVIVREDLLGKELPYCPTYCSWKAASDAGSMYNTPPCYNIYVTGLYLQYVKEHGGISHFEQLSATKSGMIYDAIDGLDGFYTNPVEQSARSRMNIPFQIQGGNEALEKKFLEQAKTLKLFTLNGHRSVGGCRASLYNGMPMEGVQTLRDFMNDFASENAA